jgi:F-type H+-transporting ATPase subunit epsilon
MPILCEIISQDRIVFQGNADIVVLPGSDGAMGILPHHTPVLTSLKYGVIEVRFNKEQYFFTVAGGVAEVQPEQVTILADAAENVLEIDQQRAEKAKQRAEEMLKKGIKQDTDTYLAIQAALRRSDLRLEAVKRYKKRNKEYLGS